MVMYCFYRAVLDVEFFDHGHKHQLQSLSTTPKSPSHHLHKAVSTKLRSIVGHSLHLPQIPPSISEVTENLTYFLNTLHNELSKISSPTVEARTAWEIYLKVSEETTIYWDSINAKRSHKQRDDQSIFVSIASFRGSCIN